MQLDNATFVLSAVQTKLWFFFSHPVLASARNTTDLLHETAQQKTTVHRPRVCTLRHQRHPLPSPLMTNPVGSKVPQCPGVPIVLHSPLEGRSQVYSNVIVDKRAGIIESNVKRLACRVYRLTTTTTTTYFVVFLIAVNRITQTLMA